MCIPDIHEALTRQKLRQACIDQLMLNGAKQAEADEMLTKILSTMTLQQASDYLNEIFPAEKELKETP